MNTQPQLAFVFPGQGSQQVGMLNDTAGKWPVVKETFLEASEVLGFDLWRMVQEGDQETLNLTENTQPALLTASVATARVWYELTDLRPGVMAGHSLGEWSALVCAGVVAFEDAVRLVRLRGKYMQEAVPPGEGGMAAIIGLDDQIIADCCARARGEQQVGAVNFNAPGQVVIAGHTDAVARAVELCKSAGAKRALPLPVSAPFHTGLMRPAADRLGELVSATDFGKPGIPVIHNVTARAETDPQTIKQLMIEQIYAPVRWVECVQAMISDGAKEFVEIGPGKVLNGLIRRIDKSVTCHATDSEVALQTSVNTLQRH